jgi:hypothetical protein
VHFNEVDDLRERILKEVDDTFDVELRTEKIKKHILAVAFVELRYYIRELILHGKGRRSI